MKIGTISYELISNFSFILRYHQTKTFIPPLFGLLYNHECCSCFSIYQQKATKLTTNKRDKITLTRNASSALENQFTRPYPVTLPGKTKEPISCFLFILKVVNLERRSAFENFHINIRNFYGCETSFVLFRILNRLSCYACNIRLQLKYILE